MISAWVKATLGSSISRSVAAAYPLVLLGAGLVESTTNLNGPVCLGRTNSCEFGILLYASGERIRP